MSEYKRTVVVGSAGKGMMRAETKALFRSFRFKVGLLGGIGALLLFGTGSAVYLFTAKPDSKPGASSNSQTMSSSQSAYDRAYAQSLQGNPGPLKSYLGRQLQAATTPVQKVQAYNQQVVLALNSGQYDDAISVGMQAYAVLHSSQTADLVANAYEAKGDKADAKIWFQNAINDLDKNSSTYHTDLGQYEAELLGLGS